MDRTTQFVVFAVFSVLSLLLGYVLCRRNIVREEVSRPIHLATMVLVWSPVSMLSMWRLTIDVNLIWLALIQIVLVGGVGLLAIPLAKLIGCHRKEIGVMACAAGLGNIGLTLGAYLCYCIVDPAADALAYAMAFTIVMHVVGILIMFPVCRYFGELGDTQTSLTRLILLNFVDYRSISLHFAVLGFALAVFKVPFPQWIDHSILLPVLFYLGGFGTYIGIGMRLHLSQIFSYGKHHVLLAIIRFGLTPLIVYAMLRAISLTAWPVDPVVFRVIMIEAFMPAAVMTVMLANLFHLDTKLATLSWIWNTVLFLVLVLPLLLLWA